MLLLQLCFMCLTSCTASSPHNYKWPEPCIQLLLYAFSWPERRIRFERTGIAEAGKLPRVQFHVLYN